MIKPILDITVKALLDMDDWTLRAEPPIIVPPLKRRRTRDTGECLTKGCAKRDNVGVTVTQNKGRSVKSPGIIGCKASAQNDNASDTVKQNYVTSGESFEVIDWNAGGCITLAELSALIPSDLRAQLKRCVFVYLFIIYQY